MSTVIKVENLSKRYRLGLKESRKDTLMGQIGQTLRAPLDNFKRLRSMTRFDQEDDSVFWALRDINFEVKQGEVLGIIGHNGAGKSTLLKILSRITEPTDGRILVNGRIAALLEVGTGFHQDLTGRENIYMNGTILGMTRKEIDRKLDEIVDFSGVEKHLDTPVKFYSSGMKVRLGFAVAAHLEPEILIIDEVLAVGDFEFQKKALGKMKQVSTDDQRTVIFVSHDMAAVRKLCSRGLLLKNGKVSYGGSVQNTIEEYTKTRVFGGMRLDKWPRQISTGEAKFTELKLLNQQSKESNVILYGEPISLKAKFSVNSNCNIGLDVLIKTYDDQEILHISSALQELSYSLSSGVHEVHFEFENPLIPGNYLITMGIHHASGGMTIDYCENIHPFEVLSVGYGNSLGYNLQTKFGVVIPNFKIKVN